MLRVSNLRDESDRFLGFWIWKLGKKKGKVKRETIFGLRPKWGETHIHNQQNRSRAGIITLGKI